MNPDMSSESPDDEDKGSTAKISNFHIAAADIHDAIRDLVFGVTRGRIKPPKQILLSYAVCSLVYK